MTIVAEGPVQRDSLPPVPEDVVLVLDGSSGDRRPTGVALRLAERFSVPLRLRASGPVDATLLVRELRGGHPSIPSITIDDPDQMIDTRDSAVCAAATVTTDGRPSVSPPAVADLLAHTPASVVLSGNAVDERRTDGPLVIGLDGSHRAQGALALAGAWARALDRALWVIHVRTPDEGATDAGSRAVQHAVDRLRRDGVDAAWEVVWSPGAVAGLLHAVEVEHAGLLVATTHGRTGLERQVIGGVTAGLLAASPVPVLLSRCRDLAA
ncbi:MAG: universal stress protein [Actinomycetota bacterium]|nr:universal stress protein [Actinomycetota bacterium]